MELQEKWQSVKAINMQLKDQTRGQFKLPGHGWSRIVVIFELPPPPPRLVEPAIENLRPKVDTKTRSGEDMAVCVMKAPLLMCRFDRKEKAAKSAQFRERRLI